MPNEEDLAGVPNVDPMTGGLRYLAKPLAATDTSFRAELIRMKRFFGIQGCIAVFSAFLLGPFTHVHEAVGHDDHGGEERSAVVHSHISFDAPDIVESGQTTVRQPRNGGERQLTIFHFQKQSPAPRPSLVTFALHVSELMVRDFLPAIPDPVAHAPPGVACFGLRSPPA
jgi:hypothetical protein